MKPHQAHERASQRWGRERPQTPARRRASQRWGRERPQTPARRRAPVAGKHRSRSLGQLAMASALRSFLLILWVLVGLAASACSSSRAAILGAACDGGDANACEVLAAMHLLGEGAPKDEAKAAGFSRRAMTLRSKACSEGDRDACAKLGM